MLAYLYLTCQKFTSLVYACSDTHVMHMRAPRTGSLSMAAGEYVSVAQQADTERADVEKERAAQEAGPAVRAHELQELEAIWIERGLAPETAKEVAVQLTEHDAVRAHARDELGIDIDNHPNPWTAAIASAVRSKAADHATI